MRDQEVRNKQKEEEDLRNKKALASGDTCVKLGKQGSSAKSVTQLRAGGSKTNVASAAVYQDSMADYDFRVNETEEYAEYQMENESFLQKELEQSDYHKRV